MSEAVRRLQVRLQSLYAVEPGFDAADFVLDAERRAEVEAHLPGPMPRDRESLWILEEEDGLSLGLCLDEALTDPDELDDDDLDRYCALLEGVSHLLYVVDRARASRPVSCLELELQAEVDKFLGTWLVRAEAQVPLCLGDLQRRLFLDCRIPERADPAETHRYRAANRLARRYCAWLHRRYLGPDRLEPLWPEVRRFWRMGQSAKIAHIESR